MTDQKLTGREVSASPAAEGGAERAARHRELGLASVPDERFDEFARELVERTGAIAAMVDFVGDRRLYFAGLAARTDLEPGDPVLLGDPGREMALDHGFCPHVVARRKALVLDDVYAYPRFAGNPVVDELGVRSYLGAPLIDDDGTVIGTVCAVDPSPKSGPENAGWGKRGLETIKQVADDVLGEIRVRRRASALIEAAPGPVMVTVGENLEVLYANSAHERFFGAVRELGAPAVQVFPGLGAVGLPAAVQQALRFDTPVTTEAVRLADGHELLFAVVPAQVPGHHSAQLTVGVLDAEADTALALAYELSESLAKL
ncbi:MAG TPA: GAF domain-containing protein [Actinocrinis sp.]|uniref:GAF domain-containing protein n=1 Tax=Actinocrinis sp. TaxID=1920516 RepID=UPI002DDCD39A|nr:GAF domain-containing protein [Actinocrinis sp.]HEV2344792.1 GAF domain-containing protein [Actinocrinis sp.]